MRAQTKQGYETDELVGVGLRDGSAMTAPLEGSGSPAHAQPEAVATGMGTAIQGRSLGQIAWLRLKRDKVALADRGSDRADRIAGLPRDGVEAVVEQVVQP